LGNAAAHTLLERVTVAKRPEIAAPRSFADYGVGVADEGLPPGVQLTRLVG
jgi:CRISPR-associated protein Csd2